MAKNLKWHQYSKNHYMKFETHKVLWVETGYLSDDGRWRIQKDTCQDLGHNNDATCWHLFDLSIADPEDQKVKSMISHIKTAKNHAQFLADREN